LRVCVLAGSFQLSGLAHLTSDLVAIAIDGHHPDLADDCDEHNCPPGCPSCHHAHSGAVPLASLGPSLSAVLAAIEVLPHPATQSPPPERSLAPPDRPPRA
jgi:hypothetical protein